MATENFVTVTCLLPHCTRKLKPLDVSFMGPLITFFVQATEKYLKNTPTDQSRNFKYICFIW